MVFFGCADDSYSPKPRGYFRLSVPEQEYKMLDAGKPYNFEINTSADWIEKKKNWGDVYYKSIKGRLQLTYLPVDEENLEYLLEEGRNLAYEHTSRADGIEEIVYSNPNQDVHGVLYQLKGEAATSTQFFVTDSANHFLRGVLYFYSAPNPDSLKPVNDFMLEETIHLIETLEWQNSLP